MIPVCFTHEYLMQDLIQRKADWRSEGEINTKLTEINTWLVDHNCVSGLPVKWDYHRNNEHMNYWVDFPDQDTLMLFKLTWH